MDYEMRYLRRRQIWDVPSYIPEIETSIPQEEELLPVVIRIFKENDEVTLDQIRKLLADYFWLDNEAYYYRLDNWKTPLFYYRVYRIVYHLFRHFLLIRTGRGRYRLSRIGRQVAEYYPRIKYEEVQRFPIRQNPYRVRWLKEDYHDDYSQVYIADISDDEAIDADIREYGFSIDTEHYQEPEEPWFNLSEEEFWKIYFDDTRFRNLIKTGRVLYHKGRLLLIKYTLGDGKYSALEFRAVEDQNLQIEIRKNFRTNEIYFKDVLYYSQPVNRIEFLTLCKKKFDYDSPEVDDVIETIIRELPYSVAEIFVYLRDKLKIKWNKLARVMGVSDRELRNWKNPCEDGQPKVEITLEAVVAICLALQLPPEISRLIIERINAKDKNGDMYDPDAAGGEQRVWKLLLERHYTKSTLEINEICKRNNVRCLFSENEEDHQDDGGIDHGVERRDKKY